MRSEPSVCQWGSRGRRSPPACLPSGAWRKQTLLFVPSVHLPELRFFICVFTLETQLLPLQAALVLATFLLVTVTGSFLPSFLTHSKWLLRAHFSVCPVRCPPHCPRPLSLELLRGSLEPSVFPPYVLGWWPLQVIATGFMGKERDTQNRKLIFSRSRETQNGKITSP